MSKRNTWFIVLIVAMLFWGGSWTSAKLMPEAIESEVIIFWRFLITFISFIPIMLYVKEPLKINKTGFFQLVLGTIFLISYNLCFFEGVRNGLAGKGGVIVTTLNPMFTFLLSAMLFNQTIKRKDLFGLFLGLSGGAILVGIWNIGNGKILDGGNIYFLFAALSWALLSITSQKSKNNLSPLVFSFYLYGFSTIGDFFIALPHGAFDFSTMNLHFWLNILYISLGATTFGTTAYFFATTYLGANKASSFIFVVPVSAIFFSWIILDEVPTIYTVIGGLLALIAVYIINVKPKKRIKTN